jgi:hypothetical protein
MIIEPIVISNIIWNTPEGKERANKAEELLSNYIQELRREKINDIDGQYDAIIWITS